MKKVVLCFLVLCAALLGPSAAGARPARSCTDGRAITGIEDTSGRRFDGVRATVTVRSAFAGLEQEHEWISGAIAIGLGRTYAAISLRSDGNGERVFPWIEWRGDGQWKYGPVNAVSRSPWLVHEPHSLLIERTRANSRWRLRIDGRTVFTVPLDDRSAGLGYPRVYLNAGNIDLPCNNRAKILFTGMYVKPAGTQRWVPFTPAATTAQYRPGYRMRILTATSFVAAPVVSGSEWWGFWGRMYGSWVALALTTSLAPVLFWTRRSYWRDLRLSLRMLAALLFLVLLYLPFLMLGVFWVYGQTNSLLDAGIALAVELCLALSIPFFSDRLVLRRAGARLIGRDEAREPQVMIERLCALADLPKPRVAVTRSRIPGAFATGAGTSATIVISEGLLDRLDARETEAVLAHELAHIANGDAFVTTLLSLPVNVIGWLLSRPAALQNKAAVIAAYVVTLVLLWWLAPLLWIIWALASLLMLTISRAREYAADGSAVLLTGAPERLMSALVHLSDELQQIPTRDLRKVSALSAFLIVPTRSVETGFTLDPLQMIPSHPPLHQRLERLSAAARSRGARLGPASPRRLNLDKGAARLPNHLAKVAVIVGLPNLLFFVPGLNPYSNWPSAWYVLFYVASTLGSAVGFRALGRAQAGAAGFLYASTGLTLNLIPWFVFITGAVTGFTETLLHLFELTA